ncbi:MAG: hypothetical protein DRR42_08000 [Gammaproteobacteria bacterium]|nr:MAG: hypothetical protein DRR42_08000 [Gammaproteobacteria bacterium]
MDLGIIPFLKNLLVFYSSYFTKKDKNIWVFGAIRGQKYADNAKYLFEYVNQHTDIQAIWISKNHAVVDELVSKGFQAYFERSREALHYAKRAKIAVITHRGNRKTSDLPFQAFSKKTKIIQLWHGIPLKKIAYDDTLFSFRHDEHSCKWKIKQLLKKLLFPFLNYVNDPALILALSDESRSIFARAFRMPEKKVIVTGYPRNDVLLTHTTARENQTIKNVIYMPTFRGAEHSNLDLFLQCGFDVEKLDLFLRNKKMNFYIKLHVFNRPTGQLLQQLAKATNISFLEHDNIYEILEKYDLLITDYSSVYLDYLLLNRPIIFAPFHHDNYVKQDRGFYFNYDDVTPGPKVKNWDEIMEQLCIFSEDTTCFAKERSAIKDRFHYFQDNQSTRRVYEAVADIASQE